MMSPFEYTTMTFDTTGSARKAIDNIMKTVFGEDGSITCERVAETTLVLSNQMGKQLFLVLSL